jgi:hypothetical protein
MPCGVIELTGVLATATMNDSPYLPSEGYDVSLGDVLGESARGMPVMKRRKKTVADIGNTPS